MQVYQQFKTCWRIVENAILVLSLSVLLIGSCAQIILRWLAIGGDITWIDPMVRCMVLWVGLWGAVIATREHKNIAVDALSMFLHGRTAAMVQCITNLFCSGISWVLAWYGVKFVEEEAALAEFAFASVPAWAIQWVIPVCFAIIAWRFLMRSMQQLIDALTGISTQELKKI